MQTKATENFLKRFRSNKSLPKDEAFLQSYALLSVVFDEAFQLMGLLKPDGTLIKINKAAFRSIKGKESEVIGRPFWDTPWWAHSREEQKRVREGVKAAARGEFIRFETTHAATHDGGVAYIDFSLKPVKDEKGNVVLIVPEGRDITERRRAEEALREAAVKYRIVADNTFNWEFWLSPEGRVIYTSPSCERICGYEVEAFNADPGLIWDIVHPDDRRLVEGHRHEVREAKVLGELEFRIVHRDGHIRWIHHVCQPVFDDNGTYLGIRGSFSDITEQKKAAAALLDNARINRELEIAKEIQQSFLPVCPSALPGVLMACCCHPATHVGGDYYDFFTLEEGAIDMVIADVTGHSVGSSLLMTMARSVLNAKVTAARPPGKLLEVVNDLLHDDLSRAELQISMFYIRLDAANHTLSYANAGHNHPVLYHSEEGSFVELDADGMIMGVMKEVGFEEKSIRVAAGDIFILYTDGVTEAESAGGEPFGTGRLCEAIAEYRHSHPREIMGGIFQKLTLFTGARPLSDDVAMIIVKIA
ncbi:SpoIIE family protein phosphatase [Geobacter grbiciae]|uniref:SpoIIE family protein phosphatase n=1 Tax=Geobacter grbiciae TaxID=155042 RepID=UPI001C01EAF9|nr:SpoIIE family protein phosphatase [Geobacter grbiciae]MBT1076513.1 SpoIIE family protein phosphatase [Geobacter grbiciae]